MSIAARPTGTAPCPPLGRTTPSPPQSRLDRRGGRPASATRRRARQNRAHCRGQQSSAPAAQNVEVDGRAGWPTADSVMIMVGPYSTPVTPPPLPAPCRNILGCREPYLSIISGRMQQHFSHRVDDFSARKPRCGRAIVAARPTASRRGRQMNSWEDEMKKVEEIKHNRTSMDRRSFLQTSASSMLLASVAAGAT